MPILKKNGDYLECPKCTSIFIDYDFLRKRFRCLEWRCQWLAKSISECKDYEDLIIAIESEKSIKEIRT